MGLLAKSGFACLAGLALWGWPQTSRASDTPPNLRQTESFRRPTAVCFVGDGGRALTANRRSGTVSLVDVVARRVLVEAAIGERLADLVALAKPGRFVALDDRTHEAIVVEVLEPESDAPRIEVRSRCATSRFPTRAALAGRGLVAVSCLWSSTIDVVELGGGAAASPMRVVRSITLPFQPQEIVAWPGDSDEASGKVIVAAAFGERLAVVDAAAGTVSNVCDFDGHNIRGLACDAERDELLVAHQRLDSTLPTTAENVRPGRLVSNVLRRIPLAALGDGIAGTEMALDTADFGAADPDAIVPLEGGGLLVLASGVGQLLEINTDGRVARRRDVGARPLGLVVDRRRLMAVVANSLGDTLSVVDLGDKTTTATIALGPSPKPRPRDRGERLFYDAGPTRGAASCHSCHADGHTPGLLADTKSDGTYGTPKRIPTLLGTSITDTWNWNGETRELREQVARSFAETMHATGLGVKDFDDVVAYLHTLPFPPPALVVDAAHDEELASLIERGQEVFRREGCVECHVPSLTFTTPGAYDVGLRDERGLAKFNPPSLRGVGQATRLLHDGRARSLRDVLERQRHQLADELAPADAAGLEAYLRSL